MENSTKTFRQDRESIMISIVIIVKNDRGIENTLNKLRVIPQPIECEIIVVDASNGRIDDIKVKFPEVRWLYYPTQDIDKTTIPEQRNLGVKESKGNIIVFIDANCIPNKNWLIELYKSYEQYHNDIICGPIKPTNSRTLNNIWHSSDKSIYRHECPSANILIDKQVYSRVGYYDEKLLYGEDVDFTWRAVDEGFKIRFNHKAIVTHDWGNLSEEVKRSFKYGKARAILYKKHFRRWKTIISNDRIAIAYAMFILGLPITILFPLYPLFVLIPFIKNINRMSMIMTLKLVVLNLINGLGILKGFLIN